MTIQKATPQAITYGINDKSVPLIEAVNEAVPAHLPLIYTLAGWGSYDAELVDDGNAAQYGAGIFDNNSPYGTHQTVLAQSLLAVGNPIMLKRVRLDGAKKSRIRISVEVATFLKPIYMYDDIGNIVYQNVGGISKPVVREYINATRLNWHTTVTADRFYPEAYRGHRKGLNLTGFRSGNLTGAVSPNYPKNTLSHASASLEPTGTFATLNTTLYPILDVELIHDGQYGDQIGLVLSDVTANNSINTTLAASLNSYIYGLQVIEYDPITQRRRVIEGINGDATQSVVFGHDVYNPRTSNIMSIKDVLEQNYNLFGEVHFYKENYDRVLENALVGRLHSGFIVKGEQDYLYESTDTLDIHSVLNILGGTNASGQPYQSFTVTDSPAFGGVLINGEYPIYGFDGADGLVYDAAGAPDRLENLKLFDEAVRYELNNFGDTGENLLDMAKYPISTLWDTGFALDTKKALATVLGKRRDIYIVFATFTVADYVESVDNADNRISCVGASSSVMVFSTAIDCIFLDEVEFYFPNDVAFQALGAKLQEYGIRLSIVDLEAPRVTDNETMGGDSLAIGLEIKGLVPIHYLDFGNTIGASETYLQSTMYGLVLDNMNPKAQTRVRFRPHTESRYPVTAENSFGMEYMQYVACPDSFEFSIQNNNRTLGYVDGEFTLDELDAYQVTVCLDKYVPRAISCDGATPEVGIILDNTKLYSLAINGEVRAIGMTVHEIMEVLNTQNATTRAYELKQVPI